MQNDMTKGSPLRLIVFFTIPVLLGNIFQNVYNLMDSIIVGRFLGVNALAAVGATGTLTFLVFGWICDMHAAINDGLSDASRADAHVYETEEAL